MSDRRNDDDTREILNAQDAGAAGAGDHESCITVVSSVVFDALLRWLDEPPGQPPPPELCEVQE